MRAATLFFPGTLDMSGQNDTKAKLTRRWFGTIALAGVHVAAFGMLYLVVVQMNWAFADFFKLVGTEPTPRFETISIYSDLIAAYTPIVMLVIALDILVLVRLSLRASRWTSAYSHTVVLCMGLIGFLWTGWAVETMARGAVVKVNAQAVSGSNQSVDVASLVVGREGSQL
jgi:hypothetical protein